METKPYEYAVTIEYGGLVMGEWRYREYNEALKTYHYAMMQRRKGKQTYAVALYSDDGDDAIHQYIYHPIYGVIVDI